MRSVLFAILCSTVTAQTTWIVDDVAGPGVDFASLPQAVAAVSSGDTLMVRAGHYQPFHVSDKALTILGEGANATVIDGVPVGGATTDYVRIASPPAGQTFRVSGLTIRRDLPPTSSMAISRLAIWAPSVSAGRVVLTDLVVEPVTDPSTAPNTRGTGMTVSAVTTFASRCSFRSGIDDSVWAAVPVPGYRAPPAVLLTSRAQLVADDCAMIGGSWGGIVPYYPTLQVTAGIALEASSSSAWIMRSNLIGGSAQGGPGTAIPLVGTALRATGDSVVCVYGGAGQTLAAGSIGFPAPAIATSSPAAVAVFGPIVVVGGTGPAIAMGTPGTVSFGLPARPIASMNGVALANGDLDSAQPVTFRLTGAPLQPAFLFAGLEPALASLPVLSPEPLLVPAGSIPLFGGLLDPTGDFSWSLVPATTAPLLVNLPLHLQGFVFDAATGRWLGSNAAIHRIR